MSQENDIISEKVVASEQIKHSALEKIPGYQKFKNLGSSFFKVFWGIVLVFIAMVFTYTSVKSVKDNSKIVLALKTINVKDNTKIPENTLVKLQGKATTNTPLEIKYQLCKNTATTTSSNDSKETIAERLKAKCATPDTNTQTLSGLIYYSVNYERYEQHVKTEKETRTVTKEDGKEYKETVETKKLEEGWHTIKTDNKWTKFNLGSIVVDPIGAKTVLHYQENVIDNVYIPEANTEFFVPEFADKASSKVGDTRLTVKYIPTNTTMLVIGTVRDGEMASVYGDTFIISNLDNTALIRNLEQGEKTARWGMRFASWVLYTLGFMLILGPILAMLDFIPIVGKLSRGLTLVLSALISLFLVAIGVFIVRYFALIFLLIIIATGFALFGTQKMKNKAKNMVNTVGSVVKR